MGRPRKVQPAPVAEADIEQADPVIPVQPAPVAARLTLADLGYKPGDIVSFEHINLLANQ